MDSSTRVMRPFWRSSIKFCIPSVRLTERVSIAFRITSGLVAREIRRTHRVDELTGINRSCNFVLSSTSLCLRIRATASSQASKIASEDRSKAFLPDFILEALVATSQRYIRVRAARKVLEKHAVPEPPQLRQVLALEIGKHRKGKELTARRAMILRSHSRHRHESVVKRFIASCPARMRLSR